LLIRCPHCDHRILVRNAQPRTYQLACPKCQRELFMLIEGIPGPDQRLTVFESFKLMKKQILQAKASRPTKQVTTDPVDRPDRPERPQVIHGTSVTSSTTSDPTDDEDDYVVPQRPDSPMSVSYVDQQQSMVEDAGLPDSLLEETDKPQSTRILPHAAPVAFSVDDEDQEHDLLEEALAQVNEEHMVAPVDSDQKVDEENELVDRPDTPRVMEEELAIKRKRPEFNQVDEVIPTFPTDKQQQENHPDINDTDHLLVMNADDLQAAQPSMLLDMSNDEEDTAAVDASMDEDKPVEPDEVSQPRGWRKWFGKS